MPRLHVPAALSVLVLAAVAGPGLASPSDGYCSDRSCPYYDVEVILHVIVDNHLTPDREAEGTCHPVQFTGGEPRVMVYPILNMMVYNNCVIKDGILEDGPIIGTIRRDGAYETPASVTITPQGEEEETGSRVVCVPLSPSSSGPRVQVYSGMDMYNLDACSIDWSTLPAGELHAYLTISPGA